jgi:ribA/ribD-fused uncharacterized protein
MNTAMMVVEQSYVPGVACSFKKVDEKFGGFSNMSNAFPVRINDIWIANTEALYQALRFPGCPAIQEEILKKESGMSAKMASRKFRNLEIELDGVKTRVNLTRNDWEEIKIDVMEWILRLKLAQHWVKFGMLLDETEDKDIVEESYQDRFWGTKRLAQQGILIGNNVLGKLLVRLREEYRDNRSYYSKPLPYVEAPPIGGFLLMGQPVQGWGRKAR